MLEISLTQFEAAARAFFDANAQRKEAERAFVWGEGSEKVGLFDERSRDEELVDKAVAQEWRAKRYDAGYGWITGPSEYGGRGLPQAYQRAWDRIEGQYLVPVQNFFGIGLGMVAPTILDHGTQEAKDLYLRRLYRTEIVACQLFSEPGAGSGLASLSTKAERDGDEWVITGQNVRCCSFHAGPPPKTTTIPRFGVIMTPKRGIVTRSPGAA